MSPSSLSIVSDTSSHTQFGQIAVSDWTPEMPPKHGEPRNTFHAYMLLQGFSIAFHAASLGRSRTMISNYQREAQAAAKDDPSILTMVREMICSISPADGVRMAQLRGSSHLPYWSRLAISEWCKRRASRQQIANAFHCSTSTVSNVLAGNGRGYDALSGVRKLTASQRSPPGMIRQGKFDTLLTANYHGTLLSLTTAGVSLPVN